MADVKRPLRTSPPNKRDISLCVEDSHLPDTEAVRRFTRATEILMVWEARYQMSLLEAAKDAAVPESNSPA